jgi:lipopolysaccharide biosynthesis glycosyltransferase
MVSRCVCYAVNQNYLFPAVASALQIANKLRNSTVSVLVFGIGIENGAKRDFEKTCSANNIIFTDVQSEILDGFSGAFANLFLDRIVPENYTEIIYLDADVQIRGPITEFIECDVPRGHFYAAADPMAFELDRPTRRSQYLTRYFDGLGLNDHTRKTYFNSGIMKIDRVGWGELSLDAIKFLKTRPQQCLFFDQSALNAVASERHIPLSLRWNFPIFFRNIGLEEVIAPSIYHFMSQPKPWLGSFPPWDITFTAPYSALLQSEPHLEKYLPRLSRITFTRYVAQQRLKWMQEKLSRNYSRRSKILAYEAMINSIQLNQ